MPETHPSCPHCGSRLKRWRVPPGTAWDQEFFLVCFNDACSYYQDGWRWMKETYHQKVSYRYMLNPTTNTSSMIPVWSDSATREMIMDDEPGENG